MSKNLTRKGLALGAAVALGSTLFAGSPASAADLITLAPSAGSTYSTLNTSTFNLSTTFDSTISSAAAGTLKFAITNSSAIALKTQVKANGSFVVTTATKDSATSQANNEGTAVSYAAFSVAGGTPAFGAANGLAIGTTERALESVSVDVQAYLDADGSNSISAGEVVSTKRTITFVDQSKVTATVSLATPVLGGDRFSATVVLDNDINLAQVADGDVVVVFDKDAVKIDNFSNTGTNTSATVADGADLVNGAAAKWNSTAAALKANFVPDASGTTGQQSYSVVNATYGASAKIADDSTRVLTGTVNNNYTGSNPEADANYIASGVRSAKTVGANGTGVITLKAAKAAGVINVTTLEKDDAAANTTLYAANQAGTASVRKGVKSFTLDLFVGDRTADTGARSGQVVTATVTPSNIVTADGVTFAGKAVTAATTVELTTNSSGKVAIAVTTLTGNIDDALAITINSEGVVSGSYTVTWLGAAYKIADADDLTGAGIRTITAGSTYSINYKVADQFGDAPANGAVQISVADQATSGRTTAADFTKVVDVVDGKATVSITDNGVGLGTTTVRATLQDKIANATAFSTGAVDTTLTVAADASAKTVTLKDLVYGTSQDKTKALLLSTATFGDYDSRFPAGVTAPAPTAVTGITLAGTVANAAGVAIAGAPVTITAPGFLFKAGSSYSKNTVSVLADSTGSFSVDFWSQAGGAQTIKIASGSASASQALTFAAGLGTAKTLVFAPVAKASAGRAIDLTAYTNDQYGNAAQGVTVAYSSTGVGYLSTNSASSSKAGATTAKLIVGSGENGVATVTVSITDVDGKSVEITKTILVGITAKIVKPAKGATATVKNALGATIKVVRGSKSTTKVATSNTQKVTLKSGTGKVNVYVNGVKVASK